LINSVNGVAMLNVSQFVDWIRMTQNGVQWRDVLKMVMEVRIS
jgi:hypothetical protein